VERGRSGEAVLGRRADGMWVPDPGHEAMRDLVRARPRRPVSAAPRASSSWGSCCGRAAIMGGWASCGFLIGMKNSLPIRWPWPSENTAP